MATQFARLLGRLEVRLDDQSRVLPAGQVGRFLGYLAYRGDWVGRGEVVFLFWPDQPERVARRNLRKLLHRTRQKVGGVEAEGESLRWLVATDLQAWQGALERRDWLAAWGHYRGPLLDGLEGDGAGEYGAWLEEARERCKRSWRDAFFGGADAPDAYPVEAKPLLQRLLESDSLDEEVLHAYLHCLAAAGQHSDVSHAYEAYERRLREDLGLEPSDELQTLVQHLGKQVNNQASNQANNLAEAKPVVSSGKIPIPERLADPQRGETRASFFLSKLTFVGRERELSRLGQNLALARSGQGNALAIEGEAGGGKTRLVEEFMATSQPVQVFSGRCFERELAAPLEPIRNALAGLGEVEVPPSGEQRTLLDGESRGP